MNSFIYSPNSNYFAFPFSLHKFAYVNLTITEQNGFRPVLVLSNDIGNFHSPTVVVAAITSKPKKMNLPTHYYLAAGNGLDAPSVVLLEQLRTIDKCRLSDYISLLDEITIKGIDRALAVSMGLENESKE